MASLVKQAQSSIEEYAEKITSSYIATGEHYVKGVIETGRLLIEARRNTKHGEWLRMFKDNMVPFSERTAQTFMQIAKNNVIANTQHIALLPDSWGTLYELTKVPDLEAAIAAGKVKPDMQRKDVRALLGKSDVKTGIPQEWSAGDAAYRVIEVINRELKNCPERDIQGFAAYIRAFVTQFAGKEKRK